jgi:flagellar FliL protein
MAEETAEVASTANEEQPASKGGMMPTLGGAIAGIALGIGIGLFVLGPRLAPASEVASKPAAHAEAQHEKQKEASEPSPIYMIDNLVLNPAGSNGTRFLLLSVALEAKDEATIAMFKARDPELRDNLLRMFGSKTADEMWAASSRDSLREETLTMLQKLFPPGSIRKVYFPQFVIQ